MKRSGMKLRRSRPAESRSEEANEKTAEPADEVEGKIRGRKRGARNQVPSVVMTARVRGLAASLGLPGKPGIVPRILIQLGRHPVALDVAATTQEVLGKDMTY